MKQQNAPPNTSPEKRSSIGRYLYMGYITACMSVMLSQPASAATIWEKASEIMQDVYSQILAISTIAAIVTASVALLMMNFSRSGRTVDESRSWLKRIIITWVILNGLGFIMAYVTPFFAGGQWTPTNLPLENSTTYLVENRQFIVRRKFGTQRTLSEILVTEISNGLLKNGVLNSSPNYRIIKP